MTTAFLLMLTGCSDYGFADILGRIGRGDDPGEVETETETETTDDTDPPDCLDGDGDGHLDPACGGMDCDDTDGTVYPGAEELCDGQDNDCDGELSAGEVDADGDGVMVCAGDCVDNHSGIYPRVTDLPVLYVVEGADAEAADGSWDLPYAQVQAAVDSVSADALVCVGPGTFLGFAVSSRSGIEVLGPGDGSAVIAGAIEWSAATDGQLAGLSFQSLQSYNGGSGSSRNLVRFNQVDCETHGEALYLGLADRENVVVHNRIQGCSYGLYMNGDQAGENHLIAFNHFSDHDWIAVHSNWNHGSIVMDNRVERCGRGGEGSGGLGVDAYARAVLWLGNTVVDSIGAGITLSGPGSGGMWAWSNLVVASTEAGMTGTASSSVGYNNLIDNALAGDAAASTAVPLTSHHDSEATLPLDGYVEGRNPLGEVPADFPREVDVDQDGDDDRGDTLCVVGAWGGGSPLFGVTDLDVNGSTVSWSVCNGDGDSDHAQAAFKVQVADEPWYREPVTSWESGELAGSDLSHALPSGVSGFVRVRVRDEAGAWSAWSDGLDSPD